MDLKASIKEVAKKNGMDLCGVASIDRFETAPGNSHPQKVLKNCKSVIVVAKRILDGIASANMSAFEDNRWDLKGLWGTYGYGMLPNFHLTYACYAIANFIENDYGAVAMPLSTGPMTNGIQMSIRHAAVAAGLGEFGWMSIVLTPEFGPRQRFGIILTSLELEPDPMYSGKLLCDPAECKICTDVCPTNALDIYPVASPKVVDMGGKHFEYGHVSFDKCRICCEGLLKEYGGKEDYLENGKNPTHEEVEAARAKVPTDYGGIQPHVTWRCGRCQTYCPVGDWDRRFKDTGLTSRLPVYD
jgi:epoxyqueuosine reductase QueG